jgi:hypothetical protein
LLSSRWASKRFFTISRSPGRSRTGRSATELWIFDADEDDSEIAGS